MHYDSTVVIRNVLDLCSAFSVSSFGVYFCWYAYRHRTDRVRVVTMSLSPSYSMRVYEAFRTSGREFESRRHECHTSWVSFTSFSGAINVRWVTDTLCELLICSYAGQRCIEGIKHCCNTFRWPSLDRHSCWQQWISKAFFRYSSRYCEDFVGCLQEMG